MRQEYEGDDDTSHHIAHRDLQKREVRIVGQAGHADDGERAGFGRHDRQRDRPPRNVAVCEKVIAQRALFFSEAQSEQRDADQVDGDDGEVEMVESHGERHGDLSLRQPRPRVPIMKARVSGWE